MNYASSASVFDGGGIYKYRYNATLAVQRLCGGTPMDPKVGETWLWHKLAGTDPTRRDEVLRELAATRMALRAETTGEVPEMDDVISDLNEFKNLVGFKRDDRGIYFEGRCVKACMKEAANIRWPHARWKPTGQGQGKGTRSFLAEHVFVEETAIPLGLTEPTGIQQRIKILWQQNTLAYEEYVDDAEINFTVVTDYEFTDEQWNDLWATAEKQGIGATRSQGFGLFKVVRWERDARGRRRKAS